jgi:hypothetical protein
VFIMAKKQAHVQPEGVFTSQVRAKERVRLNLRAMEQVFRDPHKLRLWFDHVQAEWREMGKQGGDPDLVLEYAVRKTNEVLFADPSLDPERPPWGEPVPLGTAPAVPDFPGHVLPAWLAGWVAAEAEATQTPLALAGSLALAVAGAALAGKVRVRIRNGWVEPANLFVVTALPSGERKSAVFADALVPVLEFERQEQQRLAPLIAEMASQHRILEAKLKAIEQKAAKEADQAKARDLSAEAKRRAEELAKHLVPDAPQLLCDDVTPEALARLLARQGGKMLLASAEGTAFEIAKGLYSETANFDVFLKGHSGDALRTDRVTRDGESVDHPALSCALAVQPDVVKGLSEEASMRGRGFLARWLYSVPQSRVGERTIAPRGVPEEVAADYRQGMLRMWQLLKRSFAGLEGPWELAFSAGADEALADFEAWLEPQLAEGQPLSYLAGWGGKLAGAIARLSLILHMATTLGGGGEAWNEPIHRRTVEAAIHLGRDYFLPHAVAAFGLMGADVRARDAARVVGWLAGQVKSETLKVWKGATVVSRAEIHTAVFGGSRTTDDVSATCQILIDHGYLRDVAGPWRRDSQLFEVNPDQGSSCGEG